RAHRARAEGSAVRDRCGRGDRAGDRRRYRHAGGCAAMKPFTVLVPCSTSNLGAGFDAVGIALSGPDLMVRVSPGGDGLRIARLWGEGVDRLPPDSDSRVLDDAPREAVAYGTNRYADTADTFC